MNGRLEKQITVPTGGWPMSVNDGGGVDVATVLANPYWPTTTFLAAVKAALDLATGKVFTITCAGGEAGTGQVTISINIGTFSITNWGSTDLRDALGFTGTTGAAASVTSTNGMKGVWLPDCPVAGDSLDPTIVGHRISDRRETISPTGKIHTLVGNSYRRHKNIRWTHVGRDCAIDGANSRVMSFQQWIRESHEGDLSYFAVGAPLRWYPDSVSLLGTQYRMKVASDLALPKAPGMGETTQAWTCVIEQLVEDV